MEVPRELILARHILRHSKLKGTNKEEDLDKTILGDSIWARYGLPYVGNLVKGGSIVVNISIQVDTIAGHNLPEEVKLHNEVVLYVHIPEVVEPLLVVTSKHANGYQINL